MKIYVVFGTTGEYSDRSEWPVKAFRMKRKAVALVTKATDRAKALEQSTPEYQHYEAEGQNEFDPDMKMDYTGTTYYICTVELEDA